MPKLHMVLAAALPATACSFSTYGLPGHDDDSTLTTATTAATSLATSGPDPSSGPDASTSTGASSSCGDGQLDPPEECDDGNQQDDDGCSITCTLKYRRVFATSQVYTGNLGGIAGADAKCQEAAAMLDPPGQFQAWLSTDADSPSSLFVHSDVPYVDLDLMPIASDWGDLIDGTIQGGIYKTETGMLPPESTCLPGFRVAWTSTNPMGAKSAPGIDCDGWAATTDKGSVGQLSFTSQEWTEALANLDCTCLASLYCFER